MKPPLKHDLVLVGDQVDLVALAERHLADVVDWRNDPIIRRRFFYRTPFTIESQATWFAHYLLDPDDFSFAITLKSGRAIGMVGVYDVDWPAQSGEFGRFLIGDARYRRQGYALEAARLALSFARNALQLRQLALVVQANNAAARRLYLKLGFAETSNFSKAVSDGGTELATRMTIQLRVDLNGGGAGVMRGEPLKP